MSKAVPRFVRRPPLNLAKLAASGLAGSLANSAGASNSAGSAASLATNPFASGVNLFGTQTVPLFGLGLPATGGPDAGFVFPLTMMGGNPLAGDTTVIPSRITEISLQLLNADGSTFANVPYAPFEALVNNSPNFRNASYSSSRGETQFADAVQRAEFFNMMANDWHTLLGEPRVVDRVTAQIPAFFNAQFPDGSMHSVPAYFALKAPDGSTMVLLLDQLFDGIFVNQVLSDINAGNFTTEAINFTLFPNTFLFSVNASNPKTPGPCCVAGFHEFAANANGSVPIQAWMLVFTSYISAGVFRGGVADVTGLSHEISESFNDPFGINAVPLWQFPGQPANSQVCQGNLETGDPVEVLPVSVVPINIRERHQTVTYHPQTEALLQWFEQGTTSNAIDGAFSYPNEQALTQSAVPCPQGGSSGGAGANVKLGSK